MTRRRQKRKQLAYIEQAPGLFDYQSPEAVLPVPGVDSDEQDAPEHLRFMSFGSGSSGNCSYVGTPSCGVLIDAGVDNNYVLSRLAANSIDVRTIRGILLTHDHYDHVRYAYALLRHNTHMRIYATPKAFNGLLRRHNTSRRISDYHQPIYKEFPFKVGPITVTPFETSHDGSDNVGFALQMDNVTFVVATDTGCITERADFYIRQAQYLMIEADYDAEMLRNGRRYAQYLKARIASDTGHLDNAVTGGYIAEIAPAGLLRRVWLCHLSEENNTPQLALTTVRDALENAGVSLCHDREPGPLETRLHIAVLPRGEASPLVTLL